MAIRAFITTWTTVPYGEYVRVINPILEYMEANDSQPVKLIMRYPDHDADGLPDKNRVLILAGSTVLTGAQLEQFNQLTGVHLIPPYRFDKPISEIPSNIRQQIKDKIIAEGIPLSALSGVVIWGDFLKKIVKYFQPLSTGLGSAIEDAAGEFE